MRKKLVVILMVGLFSGLAAEAALCQIVVQPPVVTPPMVQPPMVTPPMITVQPPWKPIIGVPGVEYVPTLRQDLFRYQNNYYYWHDGRWFQGQSYGGPWRGIQSPPPVFTQIGPNYWKTPPGWAHGNKTGWRGQGLPPGQLKKQHQAAGPATLPYGGSQVGMPVQPASAVAPVGHEGKGKGNKCGPQGKAKHQGKAW